MELCAFRAAVGAGFIPSHVTAARFMVLVHVSMKRLAETWDFQDPCRCQSVRRTR